MISWKLWWEMQTLFLHLTNAFHLQSDVRASHWSSSSASVSWSQILGYLYWEMSLCIVVAQFINHHAVRNPEEHFPVSLSASQRHFQPFFSTGVYRSLSEKLFSYFDTVYVFACSTGSFTSITVSLLKTVVRRLFSFLYTINIPLLFQFEFVTPIDTEGDKSIPNH